MCLLTKFSRSLWRGFKQSFERLAYFILNQLDFRSRFLSRDRLLGLRPRQLSRDRNLEGIIQLFTRKTSGKTVDRHTENLLSCSSGNSTTKKKENNLFTR